MTIILQFESLEIGSDECVVEGDGDLDHSLLVRLREQVSQVADEGILERLALLGELVHGAVVFVDELVDEVDELVGVQGVGEDAQLVGDGEHLLDVEEVGFHEFERVVAEVVVANLEEVQAVGCFGRVFLVEQVGPGGVLLSEADDHQISDLEAVVIGE